MRSKVKKKLTAKTVNALAITGERYRVWDTEIIGFHVRVSPKGKKSYGLYYRHNGLQKEITLGVSGNIAADEARRLAKKHTGKIADGKDVLADRKQAKLSADKTRYSTLKAFIDKKYEPWAETHIKDWKGTKRVLNKDFEHLHTRKLANITQWDIQKWSTELLKNKLKPATINRRVTILKSVLSKAKEWGIIEINPLAGMKRLKIDDKGRVRYLSIEEEEALRQALDNRQDKQREERVRYIKWCRERDREAPAPYTEPHTDYLKPMVLLTVNTGMRRGEIFNLRWADVDLKHSLLTVEGTTAKSGNTRHLPLNDEAFSTLVAWRNQTTDNGLVFPSPKTGERMDNIRKSWGAMIAKSGISNFRFHDLRHHFASKLVMAGVDLNTVRELLGHATIEQTLRYAHLAPEHKAAAVALLNKE